ncbi:WecB/TagA/CpsF family glycosyltransferase [Paracoccus sp. ME4]|uniref:WecB/TagA/CpsF family glycosyltransferase n=1 Tax=Paracoccus sp. ME4 TaxID=3138066 RepID=UPI00398ACE67
MTLPAPLAPPLASVNVLGLRVAALTRRAAVAQILEAVRADHRGYVCVSGVHGVIESRADPQLGAIHNRATLTVADGMPLVWALQAAGFPWAERIYGPDLMLAVIEASQGTGIGHFLYGTTPEVLEALQARLRKRFPGARIVGSHAPPFRALTTAEEDRVARLIDASGAGIVWVGLGTPRQEQWMDRMRGRLQAPMLIGVGAAFDFHAGGKRQAPEAMQRAGLEWLFRLITEPRRLWRRYLRIVPAYLALRVLQQTGMRRFPIVTVPVPDRAAEDTPVRETVR